MLEGSPRRLEGLQSSWPSASELEKKLAGHKEPPFIESVQKFFKTNKVPSTIDRFADECILQDGLGWINDVNAKELEYCC